MIVVISFYIQIQRHRRNIDTLAQMGLGAHMEVDFGSGHEGQQKDFYMCISNKRKTVENVDLLQNEAGVLVTNDRRNLPQDLFALIFTSKICLL